MGETAIFDASDTYDPENDNLIFTWTTGSEERTGVIAHFIFERAGERVVNLNVVDSAGNKVGKKFKLTALKSVEQEIENENEIEMGTAITPAVATKKNTSKNIKLAVAITLDKIREREVGDRVIVQGVVAVLPGVLGSQYFYVIDPVTGAGVQVYSNKKDFPSLQIGDKVQIIGDLSESYGERRIKTKLKSEIKKIGSGVILPPQTVEVSEIGEENEGSLVQMQGEVTEAKSTYLYLDDGTEEVKIALKKGTGLIGTDYLVGEKLQIIGLVGQAKSGYQLMPRNGEDIIKIAEPAVLNSASSTASSANMAETYLTATAGGLTSILIGLFARARGKLALVILKKVGGVAISLIKRGPKV